MGASSTNRWRRQQVGEWGDTELGVSFLKSLREACVRLISSRFEKKANNLKCF